MLMQVFSMVVVIDWFIGKQWTAVINDADQEIQRVPIKWGFF